WLRGTPLIAIHLACLGLFWASTSPWDWLLFVVLAVSRGLGVTVGYHRYFSHRCFETGRVVQFLLGALACSRLQNRPSPWPRASAAAPGPARPLERSRASRPAVGNPREGSREPCDCRRFCVTGAAKRGTRWRVRASPFSPFTPCGARPWHGPQPTRS